MKRCLQTKRLYVNIADLHSLLPLDQQNWPPSRKQGSHWYHFRSIPLIHKIFENLAQAYPCFTRPEKRPFTVEDMVRRTEFDGNGGFAEPKDSSCCSRVIEDITGPFACRPSFRAADGNRKIDVPASFSPRGCFVTVGKAAMLAVAILTLYLGLFINFRAFWFAYLTNWNVTVSSVYLLISFFNSVVPVSGPPVGQTIVNVRVKATWILFTLSANMGLVVTIVFWTMIFDGAPDIATILPHGILTLAVLLDGFGNNAIPIRLRHYLEFVLPFALVYILWTYLHSFFGVGNPDNNDEDPETNDDVIYDVLDWKTVPEATAGIAAFLTFILSPVLHVVIWFISGYRRRYKNASGRDATSYVEMSSA